MNNDIVCVERIKLVKICWACPERYVARLNGAVVGNLRLRHGHFTVECPNGFHGVGGDIVFEASPMGDGLFMEEEREHYLQKAKEAIFDWLNRGSSKLLPMP